MHLQFLGATGTVTGSKYLIKNDSGNILVDCGLYQGLKNYRLRNWAPLPVHPRDLQCVVLTHAHIDHTGYLPLLVKNGFRGPVYCTNATAELLEVLLPDSGHLQEEDAQYANKAGFSRHEKALPLYTAKDAQTALQYITPVDWETDVELGGNIQFRFQPAGHILGSSIVRFNLDGQSLVFSGDLGRMTTLTMRPPTTIHNADYLVVESTYGNRLHGEMDPEEELGSIVNKVTARGGILLIPSFAVGRAQKVLYLLLRLMEKGAIPRIPLYLDSPMAIEATRLFCKYVNEQALSEDECSRMLESTRFTGTARESKELMQRKEPAVIISASGMATGGRVLHHLKNLGENPNNCILFVGYQAAGTRGQTLIHGGRDLKIHGENVHIRAEVSILDSLSAHADGNELIEWLRRFNKAPRNTFITHGEPASSDSLRMRIGNELGWNCVVPDYLESFEL